ncbi:hypothetical protein BJ085DRAFT_30374 [Dimargaris cristalligena]|uniref:Uncharacterized protein n=1 Tax=Dimargaris cristalligena TaxID=215637 RepID=A0A4P9ZKB8_9FUNG|nr:hypothetical protein BJ085DRAFT_30374 [Dimargaris cristalligena]|eukprot:RKP33533.1 hypothetical protein BJ085DRAFT_30374 [Dimargaris cristalligena]
MQTPKLKLSNQRVTCQPLSPVEDENAPPTPLLRKSSAYLALPRGTPKRSAAGSGTADPARSTPAYSPDNHPHPGRELVDYANQSFNLMSFVTPHPNRPRAGGSVLDPLDPPAEALGLMDMSAIEPIRQLRPLGDDGPPDSSRLFGPDHIETLFSVFETHPLDPESEDHDPFLRCSTPRSESPTGFPNEYSPILGSSPRRLSVPPEMVIPACRDKRSGFELQCEDLNSEMNKIKNQLEKSGNELRALRETIHAQSRIEAELDEGIEVTSDSIAALQLKLQDQNM